MKIVSKSLFVFLILISFSVMAADDYQSKYLLGKDLIKQGRHTAAMEVLKPLTTEAEGNKFVEYSHYFYALAAFKAGLMQDANIMLLKLSDRYRDWDKMDEAYYLLGNVAFEQKKYRLALRYLDCKKKDLKGDIDKMKGHYYEKINSLDTLLNLQKDFPSDLVLAKAVAKKMSSTIMNDKQKMLLEYLIQEYKLERKEFVSGKESILKPAYNVAVLLPFMLKDLKSSGSSRTQFVYDMYEGIRMAVDTLKKKGIKINLYAYDTEKDDSKLAEVLKLPELTTMDVIIGPVYPSLYAMVNDYGFKNQILVINPLSNNLNIASNNAFTCLFQPSMEAIAGQAASYAGTSFQKDEEVKNVLIFQSPTAKDSVLSNNFRDSIIAQGFEVKYHEVVNRDNISRVQEVLGDSLMLTTVSHVFVSSTDQVLAANIISSMERSAFSIPIVTGSEWLQFSLLTYEQFARRNVHFLDSEFLDYNNPAIANFRKRYFLRTNTLPSSYAYQGFEMMLVFGKSLGKYGNYFINGLQKENFIPGHTFPGFNYSNGNSNGYVPIVKFIDTQLTVLNNPLKPYIEEKKKKK